MKYLCDPHIVPTNTCPPDLSELARRTQDLARFSQEIQLDIADGNFAPVASWPYLSGQWEELEASVAAGVKLPFVDTLGYEVHMMVSEPDDLGVLLAKAGCRRLLYHGEAVPSGHAKDMLARWRAAGAREVGVSLLIESPLESIDGIIPECDVVQLMSIARVGAQGQPFDERALSRVEELHAKYPDLMVAVDGGISESNVEVLVRAGANRLCVGSAISAAPDAAAAFATLHERAMRGCTPLTATSVV